MMYKKIHGIFSKKFTFRRLGWWINVVLTAVFGSWVRYGSGHSQSVKVFPVVWRGKIHLLGLQRKVVTARFGSKYSLELDPVERMPAGVTAETDLPSVTPPITHVILIHLDARLTMEFLEYCQQLSPSSHHVIAYGGKETEFEKISHEDKFFLQTPYLRRPSDEHSYIEVIQKTWAMIAKQAGLTKDCGRKIVIADYDVVPLRKDCFAPVVRYCAAAGLDFAAFEMTEVTGSNNGFYTKEFCRPEFHRDIVAADGRAFHQNGYFKLLSMRALEGLGTYPRTHEHIFHEIHDPTLAHRLGLRLGDLQQVFDGQTRVRYRPELTLAQVRDLQSGGCLFAHPFKQTDVLVRDVTGAGTGG